MDTRPHGAQDSQRIDVVYVWVDESDPAWQARRQRACEYGSSSHGGELACGDMLAKRRDQEALRFSLRALQTFFPGHGRVHIVTDGQRPAWLRTGNGLSIVDHRELIPAESLPVFDPGHVESYIHRIEGLSERFFYLLSFP